LLSTSFLWLGSGRKHQYSKFYGSQKKYQAMALFLGKIDFSLSWSGHRKLNFCFQSVKASLQCTDPKYTKKKLSRKKIKMAEIFKMAFALFC
jgi:hypothetical protein